MITTTELTTRAKYFAQFAHVGQTRRYTGEPYFVHCESVARRVAMLTSSDAVIAAAYLHDTIEDTVVTHRDLCKFFGGYVATLVLELTDVFTPAKYPATNRAARKKLEADRLGKCSHDAKLIKRCDIADNTTSIVENDPKFAVIYLAEKAYLLEQITRDLDDSVEDAARRGRP